LDTGNADRIGVALLLRAEAFAKPEAFATNASGRVEHAVLQHRIQFEVGSHLGFIQIVLSFADLFRIELPVIRRERESRRS
jgi:hypothetical protein